MEVTLGSLASVPLGEGRTFDLGVCKIAVFHTRRGQVFAAQAECPHKQGPLADGLLGEAMLVCPLHAWKFDLSTGKAESGQCSLRTYPARLDRAGRIVVDV
jgi:nitrite reductase (NADH) small subunit